MYWFSLGIVFFILTSLFYFRGLPSNFKERVLIAKSRFNGKYPFFISLFTIIFLSSGTYIYYTNNILNKRTSSKESELQTVEGEKKYKKYEAYAQPRIISVNVDVNIFPNSGIDLGAVCIIILDDNCRNRSLTLLCDNFLNDSKAILSNMYTLLRISDNNLDLSKCSFMNNPTCTLIFLKS